MTEDRHMIARRLFDSEHDSFRA
ncbi:MAG: hypothetical protein RL758_896, partial [Pseudomonadota bacterium]